MNAILCGAYSLDCSPNARTSVKALDAEANSLVAQDVMTFGLTRGRGY